MSSDVSHEASARRRLVESVDDLVDYGSVVAGKNGQITLPKRARQDVGVPEAGQYLVYGSPGMGLLLLVGQTRSPSESLLLALRDAD